MLLCFCFGKQDLTTLLLGSLAPMILLLQLAECCNYRCGLIYHVCLEKRKKEMFLSFFVYPLHTPHPIVASSVVWNFSMAQGCLETFKSDCFATSKVSELEGTKWTHSHRPWIDSSWQRCHTLRAKLICSHSPFPPNWFSCLFPWLLFPSSVYLTSTWR